VFLNQEFWQSVGNVDEDLRDVFSDGSASRNDLA